MTQSDEFRIEPVKPEHLAEIISLVQTYDLDTLSLERATRIGFLVSDFVYEDYQDFLDRANYFSVLLENERVVGFVLAYSSDRIQPNEWVNLRIKSRHPAPFVLIKQICIREDLTGQGLATRLYQHLFRQVSKKPLFAAIAIRPLNPCSIAFHEKLGFRKLFEVTPSDGVPRGVWMRASQTVQ